MIVVEGHTDNVGVGKSLQSIYPTNWELSTARATAVVRFLQDKAEINPERLSAVGFSYYKPIADNDTEDGRAQNRRIELIPGATALKTEFGTHGTPLSPVPHYSLSLL